MVETKVVEKKTLFMFKDFFFFRKSCHSWDNVEKYGRARHAKGCNNTLRKKDVICMSNTYGKDTDTHTFIISNTKLRYRE